jgi:hypothetical protein
LPTTEHTAVPKTYKNNIFQNKWNKFPCKNKLPKIPDGCQSSKINGIKNSGELLNKKSREIIIVIKITI